MISSQLKKISKLKHQIKKTIITATMCSASTTPAAALTACSTPETPVETTAGNFSEKSVLNFEEIKNADKLRVRIMANR